MITVSKPESIQIPSLQGASGMKLVAVAPARWRVLDRGGRAVGHLDAAPTAEGIRYSARRYHSPTRTFRDLGQFWSATDAVDCLRLSR